ncbi:hypothetical protein D187_006658 [Cystobacter fuscus DSM 2262]|uniref:Uncharacterized protein n=1 Tax=Cystobacter fuscus (strain ATCC 25194 / DSM 2262 / NBRC 100088 / M29) TaxID=1242864 RepID=S9QLU9_CYSF2|nr:hypothetical protein [Cystobacter fuscus]EPX57483.1 hypothetical protein D187_006658 [Cystobacter fuscus DSM 2262]
MKRLKFHGVKEEDYLRLDFKGALGSWASPGSELEPFLQALEEYAGEWMPDVVEGKRRRKYNRAAIWKALDEARDGDFVTIGFYRTKWPALDMAFRLRLPPRSPELFCTIDVKPLSLFNEEERCRPFVEMVRAWASRYPVSHADAHSSDDGEVAGAPLFGRDMQTSIRDGFDKIYEVSWLNVFGPKLVESVGRERMLSTPAWRVEELPNGSVLLVTRPTPADFASDEARLAQARAHVHLRPDLDFDTVLRGLRERSALLAPVEPRFPPDVEPFLSRVVERISSHVRSRKVAEFNAWRPPEPDEWRSSDAALPPDVEDVEGARAHYRYLAEHLVALLHTKVPSVFDATPESLSDVDYEFWRQEFPRVFERQNIDTLAVPAIGAYLGEVLVRHLGGQWIPRQKLEEAQVLVGDRVWLPFVRAWRYMRTCQSLLDFSLTQFYRVAERHRAAG